MSEGDVPTSKSESSQNEEQNFTDKRTEASQETTKDEELDELLDSALKDFDTPIASSEQKAQEGSASEEPSQTFSDSLWSEEFLKQATEEFEKSMMSAMSGVTAEPGSSAAPPPFVNFDEFNKQFQKLAEEMSKSPDKEIGTSLAETLKNINLSADSLQMPSEAELTNLLGGLGLPENPGTVPDELAGMLPLVQDMMTKLLSKDLLHPALKDIVEKFPSWLETNKATLSKQQYELYCRQCELMKEVCRLLEEEKEGDSEEVKKERFQIVLDLMSKMQECGYPPKDLVGDLDPNIQFDDQGTPVFPGLQPGGGEACSIM